MNPVDSACVEVAELELELQIKLTSIASACAVVMLFDVNGELISSFAAGGVGLRIPVVFPPVISINETVIATFELTVAVTVWLAPPVPFWQ